MNTYVQAGVSGVMTGGLYAVMALGLSLTWGLLKVINLAHFALILGSAYVTYQVTTSTGADPLLAGLIVIPGMFVVGVAIQWVIDRFQVDEFNSLLLSFGLFIIAIQLINNIWSADFRQIEAAENPYATRAFFIGSIAFPVTQLMALGAALALALATYFVLRHTHFGRALRALAYDREIAGAYGVDHRRMGMLTAGLASAMAAVAGVLVGINQAVFPELASEWVGLVFTVVILGGIGNLLGAVAAGILIGLVYSQVSVAWEPLGAPLVVFLLLILALLFRPNGLFGRLGGLMRHGQLAGILAVAAALAFVPNLQNATGFSTFYLVYAYFVFFWIAQSTSWNILSGYTGYFSFGQGAFFGLGVYTAGDLVSREGVNYFLTIPIAGVLGGLLGAGVGALAFRLGSLRGEIFALLTLAVTFTLSAIAQLSTWVDGGQGIPIQIPDYPAFLGEYQDLIYRLGLAVAVLAVLTAFLIQNSRFGWGLFSIRDEEDVAEELGVPTFRHKMLAITISGSLGSLSGAVAALQVGYLTPEGVFNLTVPLLVIVMAVLGGRRHWLGPVIGAVVIYSLQERLTNSGLGEWGQVVLGGILVLMILFAPEGLYERIVAQPRRAVAAGVTLVAATVFAGLVGWGIATDWLSTGLIAATLVLLVGRPPRRPGARPHHKLAASRARGAASS